MLCLVSLWTVALKKKYFCQRTPLHLACVYKAPLKVISMLVDQYPGALREKDNLDAIPLHT
eukprot:13022139-Ditylum_brightwellii.AAC.1